jgi:hypothetical protein
MTALARASIIVNDRQFLLSERMLHKNCDRKYSIEKTMLVVSLKWLVAKAK